MSLEVWGTATDLVAAGLPQHEVYFEWPGTIDVLVTPDRLLVFGSVNETINADMQRLVVDNIWEYAESPSTCLTEVPSSEERPEVIAAAVIDAVQRWKIATCSPAKLAEAFVAVLNEWLTPEEMAAVRERNATPSYDRVCASHDFCDANMAMHQALAGILRLEVDSWPRNVELTSLWNEAFDIAKREHLTAR